MIQGFKDRKTQQFFEGRKIRDFQGFASQATRRLVVLNSAESLQDLAALRSNRLEPLASKREGKGSTASESTGNGVFVFAGMKMAHMTWRS